MELLYNHPEMTYKKLQTVKEAVFQELLEELLTLLHWMLLNMLVSRSKVPHYLLNIIVLCFITVKSFQEQILYNELGY